MAEFDNRFKKLGSAIFRKESVSKNLVETDDRFSSRLKSSKFQDHLPAANGERNRNTGAAFRDGSGKLSRTEIRRERS